MKTKVTLITTLLAILFMSGCVTGDRKLAEGGVYNSDELLWNFDGVVIDFAEVTEQFLDVAERNPVAVSEIDGLQEFVTKLQETRKDILRSAFDVRGIYVLTLNDENREALTKVEALLQVAIRQAQLHLTRIALEGATEE